MSPLNRGFASLAIGVGVVLLAAGCDVAYSRGPFSIGLLNGEAAIAACAHREVTSMTLDEWIRPNPDSEIVWEARGNLLLHSGDLIILSKENPDFRTVKYTKPKMSAGAQYTVELDKTGDGKDTATFRIPSNGLRNGEWLSPAGDISDKPCDKENER